jgi:hypothetical protein
MLALVLMDSECDAMDLIIDLLDEYISLSELPRVPISSTSVTLILSTV